jgi:tetratricopeptide (TPR) repeat protein/transcriptional regulator with XRE-family HTH domain
MPRSSQLHRPLSPLRPNWRLKAARERRRWSQQDLADLLKITPNTISRWERGLNAPGPFYRRRLCELFGQSAEELGLAPGGTDDAAPTAQPLTATDLPAPAVWSVPFAHNPFFTGREQMLQRLHERLHMGQQQRRLPQALCGLAGIGKTQTAIEYCYRYAQEYQAVLWLRAENGETLLADLLALADLLGLPEREQRESQRIVEAVKTWLRTHRDWLLILDNIEDLSLVSTIVPVHHAGHVLLTMRGQATGMLAQSLEMQKMEEREAALFLLRRAKYLAAEASLEDASAADCDRALEIARLLDGLPLALDQAGAYIEETACSLADYIDIYQSKSTTLLMLRGSAVDHPASVAATLSLMIERVEAQSALAADLLRLCAFLQADAIPEEMILDGAPALGTLLAPLARDPSAFDSAIETLRTFSLVQRHAGSKTLSLHRLVQAVVQDRLGELARRQWARRTVALVSRAFPDSGVHASWSHCQRYLPQTQTVAALIEHWEIMTHEAGLLLLRAGAYLQEYKQYADAEELLLRARTILLHTVGEMHPDFAQCLNELGVLYHYQGKYTQAEAFYQQALSIREQVFGAGHLILAESLNNLGGLLYSQGKYARARVLMQRALIIHEKLLDPEAPQMIHSLHNIGSLNMQLGKYTEAEPLLLRAVELQENLLGPEHLHTLSSLSKLADLYTSTQRYEQAESLLQRLLAQREQQLGANHTDVGGSLHSLGRMYHEMGQHTQAEPLYRRALSIFEGVLGAEHPRTAQVLNDLARLSLEQGQDERGEEFCRRALDIQERKLGVEHPDYADSLATLALLCEHQGNKNRAMRLYQQALTICEGELAPEHPLIIRCQEARSRLLASENGKLPPETIPDALEDFLAACCQLHPHACCQASDLWHAYQRWSQQREGLPLTRRAFAEALRASGLQSDRTSEVRIWRGIALRPDAVP